MSDAPATVGDNSAQPLKSFLERVERLNENRDAIGEDIKEVFQEVKSAGFDVGALKKIVTERRKDQAKLREEAEIVALYKAALGIR